MRNKYQITWKMARADKNWETKFVAGFAVIMALVCVLEYARLYLA